MEHYFFIRLLQLVVLANIIHLLTSRVGEKEDEWLKYWGWVTSNWKYGEIPERSTKVRYYVQMLLIGIRKWNRRTMWVYTGLLGALLLNRFLNYTNSLL